MSCFTKPSSLVSRDMDGYDYRMMGERKLHAGKQERAYMRRAVLRWKRFWFAFSSRAFGGDGIREIPTDRIRDGMGVAHQ